MNCLDDQPEDPGTEFTCTSGSFIASSTASVGANDLMTVLPCPLQGQ